MGVHQGQRVLHFEAELADARAAMVMLHGRGGGTPSITPILSHIAHPDFAFLVPSAAGATWYPQRFIVPRALNEPSLSSALEVVDEVTNTILNAGIPEERVMLLGFSQGACLALDYAIRYPRRYGGVVALSGGLIGTSSELTGYDADLSGVEFFLGCSDVDDHIPLERVQHTTQVLMAHHATVVERIYPNMGHVINADEIGYIQQRMAQLLA